jgi:phage terminase small subunit
MSKRSAASLEVFQGGRGQLPEAPAFLTSSQSEIWRAVVSTKPFDWFAADSFPVLTAYCRAVDMDNEISAAIDAFDRSMTVGEGLKHWKSLIKMQREQQAHVATLATKLRLTPQSRYTPKSGATANAKAGIERPWGAGRVIEQKGTATG